MSFAIRFQLPRILCLIACCGLLAGSAAALPDVVVNEVSIVPSSPSAGQQVDVLAVIANVGTTSTPSGVAVGTGFQIGGAYLGSFFVRQNGGVGPTVPLAAGSTFFGSSDAQWTAVEGTHQICAFVDDIDRFTESNENNNSRCTTVTVAPPPQPDVIISGLTLTPSQPIDGDTVTVRATIRNVGNLSTPSGIAVGSGVQVNGAYLGSFFVRNGSGQTVPLGINQSFLGTADSTWSAVAGTHQICAFADDIDRFAESNENNNSRCVSVTVAPPPQPDVRVTSITLNPSQPLAGDSVTVQATVRNDGNASTPSGVDVRTTVRADGSLLGSFLVTDGAGQSTTLGAGQSFTGGPAQQWTASQGSHQICVKADDPNLIAESNDGNNQLCTQIQVGAPDPCSRRLTPADFGTVNGPLLPAHTTVANQLINQSGCSDVTLTLAPGTYAFEPNQPHRGIDLLGDLGGPTSANVTVEFEAGQYYFNHELFFSGFSAGKNLIVEGAGMNSSQLTFCQNPPSCACVDTSSAPGCQPAYKSWSMLHFRRHPKQVVVRNLSLAGEKFNNDGDFDWEFEIGVNLCLDASTCRDVMIDAIAVDGAKYSVLSKNATGLTIMNSHFEDSNIAYLPATGEHRQVLLYDNDIFNQVKGEGSKYGVFSNDGLVDSAMVKNRISNVAERGIYPGTGTDGLWIHDNEIVNAGTSGSGAGVNLGKSSINDVLVSGNDINNIGDGVNNGGLGSLPITDNDEGTYTVGAFPVGSTTVWPNLQWNGYGITVSGASGSNGAIGLVKNQISATASHGIKINPGSSRVMVYDNQVTGAGVNGLSIVPGYAYAGQYGYVQKGSIGDIWVQDNTFSYNARGGIEIVPRGLPLFDVPSVCETPDGCTHAHEPFGVCGQVSGNLLCLDLYNPTTCGNFCYQKTWQGYQVDMHANTIKGNSMANLIIDDIRQPGSGINAHYSISGMTPNTIDPNWTHNFHLYPNETTGQAALSGSCVSHTEGVSVSRSDNAAVANYGALVNRVKTFTFKVFEGNQWIDTVLWTDSRYDYELIDFAVNAPTTCTSGTKPAEGAKEKGGTFGFGD